MPARRRTLLAAATLAIFAVAWLTGRQVGVSTSLTTRVYDVRELLMEVPNYDDPPGLGLSATSAASAKPAPPPATGPTRRERIDELARIIHTTVDPGSWRDPGRAVTLLAGHIAVTHTPQTHERIAAFLSELRASRGVTVMVEATFFTLDPDHLHRLPGRLPGALSGSTSQAELLSDGEVRDLLRSDLLASVLSRPRITVFSGQRAYVLTSNQRAFVAGVEQTQSADGTVKYSPAIETTSAGVLLDLQAAVSGDRRHVTMTLRPQYSELLRIEDARQTTPDGKTHTIQSPVVALRSLHTTVNVPDRQTVLLTAFDQTVSPTTRPSTQPARQIYLLVKPTISTPAPGDTLQVLPGGK